MRSAGLGPGVERLGEVQHAPPPAGSGAFAYCALRSLPSARWPGLPATNSPYFSLMKFPRNSVLILFSYLYFWFRFLFCSVCRSGSQAACLQPGVRSRAETESASHQSGVHRRHPAATPVLTQQPPPCPCPLGAPSPQGPSLNLSSHRAPQAPSPHTRGRALHSLRGVGWDRRKGQRGHQGICFPSNPEIMAPTENSFTGTKG